jgi:hypothetical protein
MISKSVAIWGLVALVAGAGCATTRTRVVATNPNVQTDVAVMASPDLTTEMQHCEGWFDPAARVCDSPGD